MSGITFQRQLGKLAKTQRKGDKIILAGEWRMTVIRRAI